MSSQSHTTVSAAERTALAKQHRARLLFLLALTAMNAWIVVDDAPVLYHASAGHPVGSVMVTLMFGTLLISLFRVWFVTFRRTGR